MPRKTQQEWQQLIQKQQKSHVPVKLFCKQHSISPSCFYKYKAQQTIHDKTNTQFVKVQSSVAKVDKSSITIHHQQIHISLPLSVTLEWCASLMKALV